MAPARRRGAAGAAVVVGFATTAGLCLLPSNRIQSSAFSTGIAGTSRPAGSSSRVIGGTTGRSAVRSRVSGQVRSAVDAVGEQRAAAGEKTWFSDAHETRPLDRRNLEPDLEVELELVLFGTTTAAKAVPAAVSGENAVVGSLASGGGGAVDLAVVAAVPGGLAETDGSDERGGEEPRASPESPEEQQRKERRKGKKRGKGPEVVEGDSLANTPKMIALVWSSLALNAAYLLQAFSTVASPVEALGTAGAGAFVGYLIADLFSGVLHWSLDNYGHGGTPAFGAIIESFQGHHASPWTITHRPFENNVHKVTYAALPLLALLRLADPGLFGVALGVAFLFGSLMSNEFHKYSHMIDPPPAAKALQAAGLSISRKQHGRHHSGTFDEKYCLVSGICNGPMDHFRVFRFLERVVYQVKGVEPIAWKLDPSLKEVSMSTGWLPFAMPPPLGEDAGDEDRTETGSRPM